MTAPIRIENSTAEVLIETPTTPTNKVVIFLPGVSGDAFLDRFQPIVEACTGAGFSTARVNAWKDVQELEQKNLKQIYGDINSVVALLRSKGYLYIFGIGKSFGGAILLTLPSTHITSKILWAPAIGVTESGSNINTHLSAPLGSLKSLLDIKVDRTFLEKIEIPILVIHGTADDTIPFSNSEQLVSMLPKAKLIAIDGADHSYRIKEYEDAVITATINFLTT